MLLLIHHRPASQNRTFPFCKEPIESSPKPPFLLIVVVLLIVSYIGFFAHKPFVEINEVGEWQLVKWRKEKLGKALKELDEAQQYVLRAKISGEYPCYSCLESTVIHLYEGEVYKYGYTTKSQAGRYRSSLESKNLIYFVQYEGTITACMKEEKRKIYYYALLPENLKREVPLIRPPGNKQDN